LFDEGRGFILSTLLSQFNTFDALYGKMKIASNRCVMTVANERSKGMYVRKSNLFDRVFQHFPAFGDIGSVAKKRAVWKRVGFSSEIEKLGGDTKQAIDEITLSRR